MISKKAVSSLLIFALLLACVFPCTALSDSCTHSNADRYTIPTYEIIAGNSVSHKVTIWVQTICKDCFETLEEEIYTTAEEPHHFEDDGSALTCKWCEYQTTEEALQTSTVPTATPTVTATPEAVTATPNPTSSELPTHTPTPSTPLPGTHIKEATTTPKPMPVPSPLPDTTDGITDTNATASDIEPLWIIIAALILLAIGGVCLVFILGNNRRRTRRYRAQSATDNWSISADFAGFESGGESFFSTSLNSSSQNTSYDFMAAAPNVSKRHKKGTRKAKQTNGDDFWGIS